MSVQQFFISPVVDSNAVQSLGLSWGLHLSTEYWMAYDVMCRLL